MRDIDHKDASEDHVLDLPITSTKSSVKVNTENGSHKHKVSESGGGLQTYSLETQGAIQLEALSRGDAEVRTSFRIPVEAIPELISELENRVEQIEDYADRHEYDGVRCDRAKGEHNE